MAVLTRLGTVADAATLRELCDPWAIRVAVRRGEILHVGPRRHALPSAKEAHLAAARLNGVVSHLSAAIFWGWKVKRAPGKPGVRAAGDAARDRADLVDVRLRLVAEAESIEFHNDEQSFRNDIRRYTAMVRQQWTVIRFCREDVMFQQDYVRAVLRDVVAAGTASYGQFTTPGTDSRLGMGA